MGVEHAILWGVLAWLMGYIPTIGFWIAMIPPLILASNPTAGLDIAAVKLVHEPLLDRAERGAAGSRSIALNVVAAE